jgi:hypothetical protein
MNHEIPGLDEMDSRDYDESDWQDKLAFDLSKAGVRSVSIVSNGPDHQLRILTSMGPGETEGILVNLAKIIAMVERNYPGLQEGSVLVSGGDELDALAKKSLLAVVNDKREFVVVLMIKMDMTVCVRGEPFAMTHVMIRAASMVNKSYGCTFIPAPGNN